MFVINFSVIVILEFCLIFAVVSEQYGTDSLRAGDNLNSRCLKPTGQFPSRVCNKFVNCWNGIATEQECPGGLLFNSKGYCDHPHHVNCNGNPIEGTTATSISSDVAPSWTSSSPQIEPSSSAPWVTPTVSSSINIPPSSVLADPALKKKCLQPRGQFPSNVCNKYINCWDDTAVEQECPEGLLFSSKGFCDYPANVHCGDRIKSEVGLPEPGSSSECPLEYGTFRDKNNCSSYFICAANKVVTRYSCHEGFKFNDNIGVCDYENRVDCSKEPLIFQRKTNNWSSNFRVGLPEPGSSSECPLESGTFRDKNNCSSYFTCVGNEVVVRYSCYEGFKFNDNIGVCDYENRVDCSKEPLIFQTKTNNWSSNSIESNVNSACAVKFGSFRDRTNCSIYYMCVAHKVVSKHDCPPGFYFNDDIGVCDYSNRVNCDQPPKVFQLKSSFVPQLPADYMDKINNCTPGSIIRLNPQCTAACLCRNGVAEIVQCPAGLAYDSSSDKCVLPHLAKC